MKAATAVTTNEGLTGLAAQIIAAEQHRRREIMKADDAGIRDLDTHPAIVAAEDALYALQQQVPDVARTLDDVLARAALYYAQVDYLFNPEGDPLHQLNYSPTAQAFGMLKALMEFIGAPTVPLDREWTRPQSEL